MPRLTDRLRDRYRVIRYGPDAEVDPASFDALAFVEQAVSDLARLGVDAVTSSSDYPGCLVAAMVAERLGLPGPTPTSVLRASHKLYARQSMARSVPEANPPFSLVTSSEDSTHLGATLPFPIFVKPVKSWFSQQAKIVHNASELEAMLADDRLRWHLSEFVRPFNQLLSQHPEFPIDGSVLIAERVLTGHQVTVEGYVLDEEVRVTGIVDSIMYAGTSSFAAFVYPSTVEERVVDTMIDVVGRAVLGLGLRWTLFNVEIMFNPSDGSVSVIEVNPRICGQFADMMEAVNGVNSYEVLLDVALGRRPSNARISGTFAVAASFPRRRFSDGLVRCVPSAARLAEIVDTTPASLLAVYYQVGQRLSETPKHSDGASYRYATINLAASTRVELESLARQIERMLDIDIS